MDSPNQDRQTKRRGRRWRSGATVTPTGHFDGPRDTRQAKTGAGESAFRLPTTRPSRDPPGVDAEGPPPPVGYRHAPLGTDTRGSESTGAPMGLRPGIGRVTTTCPTSRNAQPMTGNDALATTSDARNLHAENDTPAGRGPGRGWVAVVSNSGAHRQRIGNWPRSSLRCSHCRGYRRSP